MPRRILWSGVTLPLLALPACGPSAAERLKDPSPAVRAHALRSLSGKQEADLLIGALHDENADVRLLAAERLDGGGENAARALVEALDDPHAGVRREAAKTLSRMDAEAFTPLYEALQDPRPRVRAGAALALTRVGVPKADKVRPAVEVEKFAPRLAALLKAPDVEGRRNAARALRQLCWEAPEAKLPVDALREATKDEDPDVRESAARVLKSLGGDSRP